MSPGDKATEAAAPSKAKVEQASSRAEAIAAPDRRKLTGEQESEAVREKASALLPGAGAAAAPREVIVEQESSRAEAKPEPGDPMSGGHLPGAGAGALTSGAGGGREMIPDSEWSRIGSVLLLTPRELEVVQHIFDGECESQIAYRLGISPHTVHTYVRRLYAKLKVTDHRELILRIFAEHLRGMSPAQGT